MGRALGAVIGVEVLVRVSDDLVVRGIIDRRDRIVELLGHKVLAQALPVRLLGIPNLRQELDKGVLGVVVGYGLLPCLVDLLVAYRNVVVALGLAHEQLVGDAIDNALAVAFGRHAAARKVVGPVLIAVVAKRSARAHDLLGNGVFRNLDAVHRCRHATGKLVAIAVGHLVKDARARNACDRQHHGEHSNRYEHVLDARAHLLAILTLEICLRGLFDLLGRGTRVSVLVRALAARGLLRARRVGFVHRHEDIPCRSSGNC